MGTKKTAETIAIAIVAAVIFTLTGCTATDPMVFKRTHPSAVETVSDASQEQWLARRQETLFEAEARVAVLVQARQELQGRKLSIQRDAAICLEARRLSDEALRAAMTSGGEFGGALAKWHAQARGVETFCAYALTVGAPR